MNKKLIFSTAALGLSLVLICRVLFGIDGVGINDGANRFMTLDRYAVTNFFVTSSNVAVTTVSTIQSRGGAVRRVVIVPGSTSDTFALYNATNGVQNITNEIFSANPTKAANFTVGLPVIYDLPEGQDAPTALSASVTCNGTTTNTTRVYISYDIKRPNF